MRRWVEDDIRGTMEAYVKGLNVEEGVSGAPNWKSRWRKKIARMGGGAFF